MSLERLAALEAGLLSWSKSQLRRAQRRARVVRHVLEGSADRFERVGVGWASVRE
jgi:hypothetical protein